MGRYDDLNFNNGTYIPQYAPLPLDTIQKTADTLAGRHYQNIASMSQLEIMANQLKSQALEGARPYFDSHINSIDQALQDMARNGGENSTSRINAIATAFQGDQGINLAQQRAGEYNKVLEEVQKLGDQAVYHKDKLNAMRTASITSKDEQGNDVLNPLYSNQFNLPVNPYLDPTADYARITNEIKPDKWFTEGLKPVDIIKFNNAKMHLENGDIDIPKFLEEVSSAGVSYDKVKRLKDEMFKAFQKTKSYQQQKEYFNGTDDKQMEDIFNYAKLGVYNQLDRQVHQVANTGQGKEGGNGTPNPLGSRVLDPAVVENKLRTPMPWDLSSNGKLKEQDTGFNLHSTYQPAFLSQSPKDAAQEEQKVRSDNFTRAITAAKEALPEDQQKGLDDKGLVQKFFKDFYSSELSNAYATTVDKKTGEEVNYDLQSSPDSWNYYNENGELIPYGSKDWIELTGGDHTKFKYGNTLSPYNLRSAVAKEDATAVAMHKVTAAPSKNGEAGKTFYISNPAAINDNPGRANTTILYGKLSAQPGQWLDNPDGSKSKILVGNQKQTAIDRFINTPGAIQKLRSNQETDAWISNYEKSTGVTLTDEQKDQLAVQLLKQQKPLIESTLPDGNTWLSTPKQKAEELVAKNITLSYKN